jgi:P4 family phage/plasmid primase-like protien
MSNRDLHHQILSRLDVRGEAVALGVEFAAAEPNAAGWLPCRAVGREDKSPSAAVNVSMGPLRGLYRDLGDTVGRAQSFFDLAVLTGRFPSWQEARAHYARVAGVPLDEGDIHTQVLWLPPSPADEALRLRWCHHKRGITPAALLAFGISKCRWPSWGNPTASFLCWSLGGRRPGFEGITALLLYRVDGEDFPAIGSLPARKTHLVRGSRDGWLWSGNETALRAAPNILKVEGASDALAIQPLLPVDWIVVSNLTGAAARPDRLLFEWCAGKLVVVIGDADRPGQAGAERFARAFARHAREVRLVRLPFELTESHGKDVRDWVAEGHTAADFQALLDTAERVEPDSSDSPNSDPSAAGSQPEGCSSGVRESQCDPHRLANNYVNVCHFGPDGLRIRFWREEWWRWTSPAYRRLPSADLRALVSAVLKATFDEEWLLRYGGAKKKDKPPVPTVTAPLVTNVLEALASLCLVPCDVEQPAWLGVEGPFPAAKAFLTTDALVDLPSLVAGHPCRLDPTPRLFSASAVAYNFDPTAGCPQWLSFLNRIWPDDPQAVELLWLWSGYVLVLDSSHHVILVIIGPPRSGKGTIARVVTELIGRQNVVAPTLSSLQTNFGLAPFLGKPLAVISDARVSGRSDTPQIVERLLSISGEDAQTVDRKYREPLTATLPTRFLVLTNELPSLRDASAALASRMLVLRCTRSWLGREDRGLGSRLLGELPGILNWAIAGWRRLQRRGHFVQPKSGRELHEALAELTSPIKAFLEDCCTLGPEHEASMGDLFTRWQVWCRVTGRDHPGTRQSFAKDLWAAVPNLRVIRPREGEGRKRRYGGIGLRPG